MVSFYANFGKKTIDNSTFYEYNSKNNLEIYYLFIIERNRQ